METERLKSGVSRLEQSWEIRGLTFCVLTHSVLMVRLEYILRVDTYLGRRCTYKVKLERAHEQWKEIFYHVIACVKHTVTVQPPCIRIGKVPRKSRRKVSQTLGRPQATQLADLSNVHLQVCRRSSRLHPIVIEELEAMKEIRIAFL